MKVEKEEEEEEQRGLAYAGGDERRVEDGDPTHGPPLRKLPGHLSSRHRRRRQRR